MCFSGWRKKITSIHSCFFDSCNKYFYHLYANTLKIHPYHLLCFERSNYGNVPKIDGPEFAHYWRRLKVCILHMRAAIVYYWIQCYSTWFVIFRSHRSATKILHRSWDRMCKARWCSYQLALGSGTWPKQEFVNLFFSTVRENTTFDPSTHWRLRQLYFLLPLCILQALVVLRSLTMLCGPLRSLSLSEIVDLPRSSFYRLS